MVRSTLEGVSTSFYKKSQEQEQEQQQLLNY